MIMADQGFGTPDYSQAVGPKGWEGQSNQGGMAGVNYVNEYSYGNAVRPAARMDQNSVAAGFADGKDPSEVRGYHTAGIGGSANPNALDKKPQPGVERSPAGGGG